MTQLAMFYPFPHERLLIIAEERVIFLKKVVKFSCSIDIIAMQRRSFYPV